MSSNLTSSTKYQQDPIPRGGAKTEVHGLIPIWSTIDPVSTPGVRQLERYVPNVEVVNVLVRKP